MVGVLDLHRGILRLCSEHFGVIRRIRGNLCIAHCACSEGMQYRLWVLQIPQGVREKFASREIVPVFAGGPFLWRPSESWPIFRHVLGFG